DGHYHRTGLLVAGKSFPGVEQADLASRPLRNGDTIRVERGLPGADRADAVVSLSIPRAFSLAYLAGLALAAHPQLGMHGISLQSFHGGPAQDLRIYGEPQLQPRAGVWYPAGLHAVQGRQIHEPRFLCGDVADPTVDRPSNAAAVAKETAATCLVAGVLIRHSI